jgi:hypothetical protein
MGNSAAASRASSPEIPLRTLDGRFDEIKDLLPIQTLIFQLTESNVSEIAASLITTVGSTRRSAEFCVHTIVHALDSRPNPSAYAALFAAICAHSLHNLPELVLSYLAPIPFTSTDPFLRWSHLTFFHFLLRNGCLEPASIVKTIRTFCDDYPEFLIARLVFFCFFNREICAADPSLDFALRSDFSVARESETQPLHPALAEFLDQLSDDPCDAWIESGYLPGTIPFVLKHDDIDALKALVFDKDDRIPPSVLAQCPIVQHNPTLLQFSAIFGAVQCFGWLLELGADVNAHDESFPSLSVMQFAIAGGNTTVIRELTRRHVPPIGGLQIAARYFRNDFFESLSAKCNVRENHIDYATMLHQSCAANNLGGLSFCFDHGSDIEARDETGKTPLHYAAIDGSVDCGQVLIPQDDVDMNARDRVFLLFSME